YLPPWAPFNIYQFSSWARATIVPMLIILARKPHCPVPPEAAIDELYPVSRVHTDYSLPRPHSLWGWRGFFYLTDKLLHVLEKTPWDPLQGPALRRAEQWILAHQEADGSWGGIQPPWVYSLLALKTLGYGMDHPAMRKGFRGFEGFAIEEGDTWRVQACIAPVWDTCLAAIALVASWLLKEQVLTGGDWQVKARGIPPGGWSFEFHNDLYPDTDDSAEVIIALAQINVDDKGAQRCAVELGVRWLLGIQSRNGGWGSFDKDNDKTYIARIPFADFGESIDPPSVDVTAHILEVLGRLGYRRNDAAVKRALRYIKKEQEPEGCWFGRWGVNYVYGTGAVLPALEAVGEKMTQPWVQRAAQWLVDHRNPDGGWGESCATYADQSQKGVGPSTASQTAWALLALLSAGWGSHAAVERGVRYLVETQEGDGSWDEPYFTGTGFPGYGIGQRFKKAPRAGEEPGLHPALPSGFMINYHLYRVYWPLMALGRYKRFREGLPVIPRVGPG
ncbi:MAG: squalene--hopene cyclase, partial [Chloroflexi bacterium]|nr:squalene--hopene cyclase [Chloroflexota bacterium]